jgi:hypothetical protein
MTQEEQTETKPNQIEELRNEFQAQFAALKESTEASIKEKDEKILALEAENKDLHTALLKSAFTIQVPKEPEPTEEELYAKQIQTLYEKSKKYSELI